MLDNEGRVSWRDRLKDMLKIGGENVAAAEIEGLLHQHPSVQLAQVVAAPDPVYQEVAAAFIQLKAGETASQDELVDFCKGKIASFKIPQYVNFVSEWPMSATKVRKLEHVAARVGQSIKLGR